MQARVIGDDGKELWVKGETRPGADIAGDPGVIRRVRGRKPAGKR